MSAWEYCSSVRILLRCLPIPVSMRTRQHAHAFFVSRSNIGTANRQPEVFTHSLKTSKLMGNTNYLKVLSFVFWLALMIGSCYLTVESLDLLTGWPVFILWILSLACFTLASIGTKLICDSLNSSLFITGRGLKLTLGIIFLLVFWVIFSFPTNTHTLFYDSAIKNILTEDIAETREALSKLANTDSRVEKLENEKQATSQNLETITLNYLNEVNNPKNFGHGEVAEKHLAKFNTKLKSLGYTEIIEAITPYPKKKSDLREYTQQMIRTLNNAHKSAVDNYYNPKIAAAKDPRKTKQFTDNIKQLNKLEKYLASHPDCDEPTRQTEQMLSKCYNQIYTNTTPADSRFSGETKTERVRSVIQLVKDFFTDNIPGGRDLTFFIILALIIDVAGFIFFFYATKQSTTIN